MPLKSITQIDKTYIDATAIDGLIEDTTDLAPITEDVFYTGDDVVSVTPKENIVWDIREKGTLIPEAESRLAFRVMFKNLNFPGYSPDFPPPIGIAIVGINNYIL